MFQRIISTIFGSHARRKSQSIQVAEDNLYPTTADGEPVRELFISNLAARTTFSDLENCFSKYGNIESCILYNTLLRTDSIRGDYDRTYHALVTFNTGEDAWSAMEDGIKKPISLHNRYLSVMPINSWNCADFKEPRFYIDKEREIYDSANYQHTLEYLIKCRKKVSIHILNNDCLRHIFEFLPISDRIRIERVCKRWKAVSLESWHTVRVLDFSSSKWGFINMNKEMCVFTLHKLLLRCGRFLTQLDVSLAPHLLTYLQNKDLVNMIGQLCPNLTIINLKAIPAGYSAINALRRNCKNITRLTIRVDLCDAEYEMSEYELSGFFCVQKNLEYLDISSGDFLSGECLTFLPAKTMRTLILRNWSYIKADYLCKTLKRLEGLEKFVMDLCSGTYESILRNINQYCINLKVLELLVYPIHRPPISLNSLGHLGYFRNLPKLENIRIIRPRYQKWMSDICIAEMVLNCQELIDVDITDCRDVTDAGLALIATLPKLETLNINGIRGITDRGLRHFCNLKVLECRGCSITNEGLSVVLTSSPELRLLDITKCVKVNKHFVKVAQEVCNRRASNVLLQIIVKLKSFYSPLPYQATSIVKLSPFLQILDICERKIYLKEFSREICYEL